MDIMELGAIGELVGGAAVIASLLFLGFQVRQGNRLNRAEALRSYTSEFNRTVMSPLQDQEFSHLVGRAMRDFDGLTNAEKSSVHAQWFKILLLSQSTYLLRKDGMVRADFASASELGDVAFLKTPGVARWWETVRIAFVPAFVEHMESQVRIDPVPPITDAVPWWASDEGGA